MKRNREFTLSAVSILLLAGCVNVGPARLGTVQADFLAPNFKSILQPRIVIICDGEFQVSDTSFADESHFLSERVVNLAKAKLDKAQFDTCTYDSAVYNRAFWNVNDCDKTRWKMEGGLMWQEFDLKYENATSGSATNWYYPPNKIVRSLNNKTVINTKPPFFHNNSENTVNDDPVARLMDAAFIAATHNGWCYAKKKANKVCSNLTMIPSKVDVRPSLLAVKTSFSAERALVLSVVINEFSAGDKAIGPYMGLLGAIIDAGAAATIDALHDPSKDVKFLESSKGGDIRITATLVDLTSGDVLLSNDRLFTTTSTPSKALEEAVASVLGDLIK